MMLLFLTNLFPLFKELYDKQKHAVKESLDARKRHMYGDTFIKHRPTKKAVVCTCVDVLKYILLFSIVMFINTLVQY